MARNLSISTKDEYLSDILGNSRRYLVPRFQRDYSWDSEQLEELWMDIESILNNKEYHYMGYLVLQEQDKNFYKIIDGQQRLTTFSLLVLAAMKKLQELNEEERKEDLKRTFIGTKNLETLEVKNKLKLNKNNDYNYRLLIEGEEIPQRGQKESVGLIRKAFYFFYTKFKDYNGQEIGKIIETIKDNLLFTTIYISDEINAYKVFETLNARGVQLSSADLLKNYLFALTDDQEDIPDPVLKDLEEKWGKIGESVGSLGYSNYILTQWNSCHKFIRKANLFKSIRDEVKDKQSANIYLDKLTKQSQLYKALSSGYDEFWRDHTDYKKIRSNLEFLKLFGIKQSTSLLLISYLKHKNNFSQILDWIKVFSLRYNIICNEHPGEQEKLYNKICLEIDKGCRASDIKKQLLTHYPNDKKFKQDFTDKTMPTKQSPKRARYLLARLAEENAGHDDIDESTLTVEHILPCNPDQDWAAYFGYNWQSFTQRLGNMALVSNSENKNLGQKKFKDKKALLDKTNYQINRLDEYNNWDSQSIESRQRNLAKLAARVWRID